MPSVAELKKTYPDLDGLDDNQVVDAVHQAFYTDLSREEVAGQLGVKPAAEAAKSRGMMGVAKDVGISALKGAIAVPEAAVGLTDIVTGGRAGKLAEAAGFRPKEAKAMLDEGYSDQQKEAFQKVQGAQGLGDTFLAAVQNPSVVAHSVVESLPSMAAGGVLARGGLALAPRIGGVVAGALGEGAVGAGSAAEQTRQATDDGLLTGKQAALAGATGLATSAFALLGGKVAQKLGIADVDTMLSGAAVNPAVRKGVVRSALEGAVAEGVLEELPQSISEQVLANLALNKPLDEGVNQAAVLGLLSGAAMGGGANAVHSFSGEPAAAPAPIVEPTGPMSRAANLSTPVVEEVAPVVAQPAPEPLLDPMMDRIMLMPDADRGEALAAYNILNREDAPKGAKQYNKKLLDGLLTKAAEPAAATDTAVADVNALAAGADPVEAAARASEAEPDAEKPAAADVKRGQFATAQEAQDYISKQRRGASINLPPALPVEFEDGSHSVAVQGTPNYEEASRQAAARRLLTAGVQEGDLLNPKGEPFKTKMAATRVQKVDGGEVIPVEGGFVVRPGVKNVQDKSTGAALQTDETDKTSETATTEGAEAAGGVEDGKPAAGAQAGPGAVEADGVARKPLTPTFIRKYGQPVESSIDAQRRFGAGDRIYAYHEQGGKPIELKNVQDIDSWASDQLAAVPAARSNPAPKAAAKTADAKDAVVAAASDTPAKTEELSVTFGGKNYPVDSLEDASNKWAEFREAAGREGGGVRDIGNGVEVKNKAGQVVAKISYNGRIKKADSTSADAAAPAAATAEKSSVDETPFEKAAEVTPAEEKPKKAAKSTKAANPAELRAKADLQAALADLGDLLGANFKANMVPEQEQKLLPVLTKLFDAAFRLGFVKFKDAAKFALDQIRSALGADAAGAITLDHLQGAYISMAGGKKGADTKRAVVDVETKEEIESHTATAEKESSDVPDTNGRVERNSEKPAAEPALGDAVSDDSRGTAGGPEEAGGPASGGDGRGQQDRARVPAGGALTGRERSDQLLLGGKRPSQSSLFDAGNQFDERSPDDGVAGISPDPIPASAVEKAAVESTGTRKQELTQKKADAAAVKLGDMDSIRATLPQLLPGQQEDVHLAEQRFADPKGYGMLFTNGTGTGKTFTGLGVAKRFALQGKTNTLITVPDEKIAGDWIEAGKLLGLDITALKDTKDAGKGITITTYANLGANDALAQRQWDLVIPDEAHSLMQASTAEATSYLENLRAITYHPAGVSARHSMLNRADLDRAKVVSDTMRDNVKTMYAPATTPAEKAKLAAQNDALNSEGVALSKKLNAARDALKAEFAEKQGAARPRLVALTATPFAYEKTVDWANGYLFDYKDGYPFTETSLGYNQPDPRQYFFMTRFGYTMRYNKLTEPDASKVDRGLLQRQFNSELKKAGSLSGRLLDVVPDYDRRFVLVESAIGNRIDDALAWVSEQARNSEKGNSGFYQLRTTLDDQFDYLSRRYLLEAIKAHEVIPIVKKHMAMGRKVVVFHDYKKGGGFNPFAIGKRAVVNPQDETEVKTAGHFNDAVAAFNTKFADLVKYGFDDFRSPIDIFKKELPATLIVNGDEKRPDLLKRYKAFQDDGTGPQVMLVQSAKNKGWSGHDTTGKHQRVLINLGQPTAPTLAIQQEGRIYRTGQASNAIMRYLNTGTNWEKWAFATTIASRASTAENLGMGELSRALKDSFIASFEQSDAYPPGHEGEGTGGKAQDKANNKAVSEYDRAKTHYWATQKKTNKTKAQEGADYFATPEPLGLKMVQWLDARSSEDVLEPSAGHGAIARWLPETANRTAIEPSLALRSRLAMAMDPSKDRIIDGTFEDLAAVNKYSGIVMNPPFGSGGKTAIDHLAKAATHLRPGGRIVALIPTGPAADKKFEKWMYEKSERPVKPLLEHEKLGKLYKGDTLARNTVLQAVNNARGYSNAVMVKVAGMPGLVSLNLSTVTKVEPTGKRVEEFSAAEGLHLVAEIKLPQVAFERAGTAVATRIVVLEKQTAEGTAPAAAAKVKDMSRVEDIATLFDRLEDMTLPPRADVEAPQAAAAPAPAKTEPTAAAPAPQVAQSAEVGEKVLLGDVAYPVDVYTTAKGKELRGVWVDTKTRALEYGPTTFYKPGSGYFVRERDFPKVAAGAREAAPAEEMPAFSRAAPSALKGIETPSGTAFQGRDIVLGNPLKNVRQPGGDVTRVDFDLRDPVLFAQARDEGLTGKQARERSHVGVLTMDIDKAGQFKSLRNIEVFQSKRGAGMAEKVVGSIMASLPDDAKLHIYDILPTAVGFWDKMGAKFARSEDFMEAFLTPQQFKDAYEQRAAGARAQGNEGEPDAPAFRRAEPGGDGVDGANLSGKPQAASPSQIAKRSAVEQAVKELTKGWANAPTVVVASNMLDEAIPKRVRDYNSQQSLSDTGAPEGFFFGGKAYLLADEVSVQDVPRVLFHEVLGHAGLRGNFGDTLKPILMQLAAMRRREVLAKAKEYGLNMSIEADRLMAAEEVLAEMAQTTPELGYVKRAIAAIRTWLRENIPAFKKIDLTDDEIINNYILPARGWVERGRKSDVDSLAPAFSRSEDQTTTEKFKKWFGDSKVVDDAGKPLVVYHGTAGDVGRFYKGEGGGMWFSSTPDIANKHAARMIDSERGNVMPVYLSMKNPVVIEGKKADMGAAINAAYRNGNDGVIAKGKGDLGADGDLFFVLEPEQIKSAIGNNGDFDGTKGDIAFSLAKALNNAKEVKLPAGYLVGDFFNGSGKLNWWHKSVGTMYNLAQRSAPFKRVYDGVQNFLNDVSYYATEAADLAPNILPKLDTWKDITKTPLSVADNKAIAAPIFEGTLVWGRDSRGQPAKMETLEADAEKLTTQQKATELLRQNKIGEHVLKMWQGLPLDQYETLVESRYKSEVLQAGIVWKDAELKSIFKLTDGQIDLYREFRAAIDKSLTSLAVSDMVRYGGKDVEDIADAAMEAETVEEASSMLRDYLLTLSDGNSRKDVLIDMAGKMVEKADKARALMDQGYAPLSRFGTHSLDVVDAGGERVYFGLFESKAEASKMARRMAVEFPKAVIKQGTTSEQAYKLFAGVSPETLELFGEMLGLEAQGDDASSKAFQEYLKLARSSRSAMKRLIQRKGIAGFSEDPGRVLAGFVYSNARQTAGGLHMGEITESVNQIPQGQGELKDAALGLADYIKNPQEEAQKFRGLLFAQYLGGSVASAMVNMTQPLTVTFPYLSQFGGITKAAGQMRQAAADVMKKTTGDKELDAALKRAEEEGIVAPQEVHQLMAQAQGSGSLKSGDGTKVGNATAFASNKLTQLGFVWGKLFSSAEQFNRRLTFIAAYRTAVEQKMGNPAAFAEKVIAETQFTYNKGSKPRWARGAIGGTLFTFKQYSVNYLELASRMATQGGPEGKKAALLMVAVLFLMGGAGGLPFAEDAEDLVDGIMQRLGYNFSAKQKRNEFFTDLLGKEAAQFLDNGISGLPGVPIDLSGRMGMGNLIPGTGLLTKKRDHTRDVVELAGPAGDLVSRAFQSANALAGGNVGKAGETLLPVAGRNLTKAVDMANTGMYRDERGRKVLDVDAYDVVAKAIGFQPNDVARVQDATRTAQNLIGQVKLRETEIADKWAQGMFEQDQDKVAAARAELKAWNENNPDAPIRIQMPQIIKRVRAMRMSKADRLAATAPKEIRAGVKKELAAAGD